VTAVHRDYVTIDIDGNDILVGRFTWSEDDRKVTGFGSGPGTTFTQFPLRLGYALTIHKAQGMSLENGYVDVGSASLQPAMTYVALSRLRSPDGLFLRSAFNSYSTARAALRFYGYAS
jgi:ATP-dependent exoDNAse (exonuclease V) alpha subunit